MHVQTTPVGKNASKKNSTTITKRNISNSNICFRVKTLCPKTKNKTVSDFNFTVEDFTNLFESLLLNKKEKKFKCWENKVKKCKKQYCVCCKCCKEEQSSVLIPPIPSKSS